MMAGVVADEDLVAPSFASRSVLALARASEPCTV